MWRYVILAGLIVFLQTDVSDGKGAKPFFSVDIDDYSQADSRNIRDEKTTIDSIIKCGLNLSEPLKIAHIEGGLIGLDYTLDDVIVSNFSKCAVKSVNMQLEALDLNMNLDCSHLSMYGKYNVTGKILSFFYEGLGETRVDADNFGLSIKGKLEEFIGYDKERHVKIKTFIPKPNYGGPVVYNLTNLFYGNEVLASEAHIYLNSNWKAVSEFGQAPMMAAALRPFFKNINKCLKSIPVHNIEI